MLKNIAKGFTLAEVLITLGIIGIVAAMTLPALVQKNNEKVTINKLKKIYSSLGQAYQSLTFEYGKPSNWGVDKDPTLYLDLFGTKLKIVKKCAPTQQGCWYDDYSKNIDGTNSEKLLSNVFYSTAELNDGTLLAFSKSDPGCEDYDRKDLLCSQIIVDINGHQKPNMWGHDLFAFLLTSDRVIPRGYPSAEGTVATFEQFCLNRGHSCAAWVLINENMDYIHCKDLSWSGKLKCK